MQRRTLVRARGLAAFRRALVDLALSGSSLEARRRVVIVPTGAAAELLRQSIERDVADRRQAAVLLPELVTRDQWIGRLATAVEGAVLASRIEREVILERAARDTRLAHPAGSDLFELRPGLVGAMLDFFDELRRRQRTPRRFVRALFAELGVERGTDLGSEHLIRQTCFLGFTFLSYGRRLASVGALDEHTLRDRLIAGQPALPFDHVVVAVADHPSDPRGLWPADFDLLGRLRALDRVDVVVTDEMHDAGFRERLEQELPGIDERRAPDAPHHGRLLRPAGPSTRPPVFVYRDREEELRGVVREIRARADDAGGHLTEPTAVVFQRPLPYLYLAAQVLEDARVPYQTFDALPLAAEPYAALVDLVLDVARTGGTRETVMALLGSPLLTFEGIAAADTAALDAVLAERRTAGDASRYPAEVDAYFKTGRRRIPEDAARRAAEAASAVADQLRPFGSAESAADQIETIVRFVRRHERLPASGDPWCERFLRGRRGVLGVLDELSRSLRRHDDRPRGADLIAAAIRHAIEGRTFTPRRGLSGVHLVDAIAARFGGFAHVSLVGLVETDWLERAKRTVFYPATLLKTLGWPQEPDRMRAEVATFHDLLGLATDTTRLTAFQLEGDAIVAFSPLVERTRGLPTVEANALPLRPLFTDELLTTPDIPAGLDPDRGAWFAMRRSRPALSDPAYSGFVDAQQPRPYRVSRVDRYVDCPFKYFSESVLQLTEERDEQAGLTPLERGTLLHALFEDFYRAWQAEGRAAITPETLPEAVERFGAIAREALARLPEADRRLEETRLLGSIVGTGVAERVFELEADSGLSVRERRLEAELNGSFRFPVLNGLSERSIAIRGKADRIDILDDGSVRVVDYKLGRMPDLATSIQIAVYAHCARQVLEAADGRPHPIRSAAYLAFGDDRRLEGSLGGSQEPPPIAVEARASAFAATIAQIEAGEFPPRPKRPGDCRWCGYQGVCRKEYLAEDDETTDAV